MNSAEGPLKQGNLHRAVLRSILAEQAKWHESLTSLNAQPSASGTPLIVSFGPERSIPPSVSKNLTSRIIHVPDAIQRDFSHDTSITSPLRNGDNDIAVIGMSCRLPGANDIQEFWDLLLEGKSQHKEVPVNRVELSNHWRCQDENRKWYGNFIDDFDAFDYKFFRKTPRESTYTDPQQRIMLEIAYQAAEQAGYLRSSEQANSVGCYLGVSATDYEHNIACYAPNAYSATGNFRSFVAGRISHYFGWTGPSLTIDTACSSSAVAIHQACRAILSGECSCALAGGANIITNPLWFQNLAAASFLSPSGQCKPFDASADGYCRGEGVGAVFLKKYSDALTDGDQVLASLSSTLVYQNENCTPVFVPNSQSLGNLFGDAMRKAQLEPQHVSYVEAHGTGTPVGDPAEYESIRRKFGGSQRLNALSLGSVKGLVGHTEGASGVVSLIKVVLMIQNRIIPPQASFNVLNQAVGPDSTDNIEITTQQRPWSNNFNAALINNYGASGSNACMVATSPLTPQHAAIMKSAMGLKQPFWISANDERSLLAYSQALQEFLRKTVNSSHQVSLADLSYNLARKSNRRLTHARMFSCESTEEFINCLSDTRLTSETFSAVSPSMSRPIILCFGGQVSTFVGLDRELYSIEVFRKYLDLCDVACRADGLPSIFPTIFQKSPVDDVVELQIMLFAMQYSCAKAWIACGISPGAIVGHSFGELTGLCVSGALALEDAIKMIARRATVIRDLWGVNSGAMLAIEGEESAVRALLAKASEFCRGEPPVTIACFNSDTSFTLAGSKKAINAVAMVSEAKSGFSSVKTKRLNVTHGFHSSLVEPLMERLVRSVDEITFHSPHIHLETATEDGHTEEISPSFVASHMRHPVYFHHAVKRLSKRHPAAVWLEAGSNSTITTMTKKALSKAGHGSHFQAINITGGDGLSRLCDATVGLWREGVDVDFWPHHRSQVSTYKPLFIPPYQFERNKCLVELKQWSVANTDPHAEGNVIESQSMFTFEEYTDKSKRCARYRINTASQDYEKLVSAHVVTRTAPICPAALQIDIAVSALRNLRPELARIGYLPQLRSLQYSAPICLDPTRSLYLYLEATDTKFSIWNWKMTSEDKINPGLGPTVHTTATIVCVTEDDQVYMGEFSRLARLVKYPRCRQLLRGDEQTADVIQGRNIYRSFADVVEYGEVYRGVERLVGREDESAGHIRKTYSGKTWFDAPVSDCFCQVAGIFVNCMTDVSDREMFVASRIEQWIRAPDWNTSAHSLTCFDVYAMHQRHTEKQWISDIFVFDPTSGRLVEAIMGTSFEKTTKHFMARILKTASPSMNSKKSDRPAMPPTTDDLQPSAKSALLPVHTESIEPPKGETPEPRAVVASQVRKLLADLTGLQSSELKDSTELIQVGLDSLMGVELSREIEQTFHCSLDMDQFGEMATVQNIVDHVCSASGSDKTSSQLCAALQRERDHMETWSSSETLGEMHEKSTDGAIVGSIGEVNKSYSDHADQCSDDVKPLLDDSIAEKDHILQTFEKCKQKTDELICQYQCAGYMDEVLPKLTRLCIAFVLNAFDRLGCSIAKAKTGEEVKRVPSIPKLTLFVSHLYSMLEDAGHLIESTGDYFVRTAAIAPTETASELLSELLVEHPQHSHASKLIYLIGSQLAEILTGEVDGLKLVFGTTEGKELVSSFYAESKFNVMSVRQTELFLKQLLSRLNHNKGPLKILEVGAGTGGFTSGILDTLARAPIPVEYTFTDLASSLVASAQRRFQHYPFMKFAVLDMEGSVPAYLLESQDVIIAYNCVHATHNIERSTKFLRSILRPGGFLLLLELTLPTYWTDLVFGVFEGWWAFDDGRKHAVAHQTVWEKTLHSAGYTYIDWTDGDRPEVAIQRIIIALTGRSRNDGGHLTQPLESDTDSANSDTRKAAVDACISKYSRSFALRTNVAASSLGESHSHVVLVTGATGSLGAHIVGYLAELPSVSQIVCLNRPGILNAKQRQLKSFEEKGMVLPPNAVRKLEVLEATTSDPYLGIAQDRYENLTMEITSIVHSAWPMSTKRGLKGFELQLQTMQNLIEFANIASSRQTSKGRFLFQFVSSIASVGHYPIQHNTVNVPEDPVEAADVLPNGYGQAKYVCERLLDETLRKHSQHFRVMSVRLGQISGSSKSGYWNSAEHFSMMLKSSQALKSLPNLRGELSWTPVDIIAAVLGELLFSEKAAGPVYHIDNPVRQRWENATPIILEELGIPLQGLVSFQEWLNKVRRYPGPAEPDNPAVKLVDFLEADFERMSCGGLLLDTTKTCEISQTMRQQGPVSNELIRKYIRAWKASHFLSA